MHIDQREYGQRRPRAAITLTLLWTPGLRAQPSDIARLSAGVWPLSIDDLRFGSGPITGRRGLEYWTEITQDKDTLEQGRRRRPTRAQVADYADYENE
ncbi:hypothetical protein F4777DRAFT_541167 [Nemania sp. FL0916]|nr:hypothetical protein F4777DRAFT_541167 [Nemania sp. FL0916]